MQLSGLGWKGTYGEGQMSDDDWLDRGARVAVDMLNGVNASDACTDNEGIGTYGEYNDDFNQEEVDASFAELDGDDGFGLAASISALYQDFNR